MANKMADKKKTTSRSQMVEPQPRTGEKAVREETAKTASREERKEQKEQPRKEQPRKEPSRQESKSARKDSKGSTPAVIVKMRNSPAGRFMSEAYYELRHKVTWPTVEEARNMAVVVVVISVVIGAILGLADYGLYNLFLYISGR